MITYNSHNLQFRFEGAGIAARNIKAAHDLEEGEKATSSLVSKCFLTFKSGMKAHEVTNRC